ncbi:MAG: hypothetical protein A2W90_15175 [Bacteroidetes bacterium GWF2_42_66]|nr:MAG: hypothetical protein A2W92_23605 [Bacteroidetes bacterium GWA2_42_15]OFX96840.1 MAG: hypothetical protein A2W89_19670 [Bacteroidetes bacterium GWE2_42_39]OFY46835.1 MAG: hypothetical protein A2W90_15175 [Bacteroidetes bacterium GWF2_42_66]HBL75124.1 energy transducer TonB [Prolixibacteraceae bacterium]HCR89193.1 energy transducer TonB [Prolixibacteraceae bacterium]
MKTKKTEKADLENKRSLFFSIGLLLSLSAVLVAFGWKTPVPETESFGTLKLEPPIEEMIPITHEEKKEVAPPVREITVFEIVEDDQGIEDDQFEIFNSEITEGDIITVQNYLVKNIREEEDVPPVWITDEMPEFPGGIPSLLKFINSSIKYPVIAQENGIHGKVIITFVIDKTGEVTNVRVFRGIDQALDAEALRVVKNLPKWKPGKQNGKPVKVNYNVPINFVLQ